MPIVLPTCLDFPLLLEVPCVRLPGGAQFCIAVPGVLPATPFEAGAAALGMVNSALAPLQPVFDVMEVILAITDTIKAVATLQPKKIAEALPNLISQVADLAGLFPPMSVPVFILDMINLIALVLEGLADELEVLNSYAKRLGDLVDLSGSVPGVAAAVECGLGHLALMLQHLGGQVEPLNQLIGLLNGFLELAGLPEQYRIPCIGVFDVSLIGSFVEVLRKLAAFLRALGLTFPQPGGVKSRVVPC